MHAQSAALTDMFYAGLTVMLVMVAVSQCTALAPHQLAVSARQGSSVIAVLSAHSSGHRRHSSSTSTGTTSSAAY